MVLTSSRVLITKPMKLLLCAIRTASFTDIALCPLLLTIAPGFIGSLFVPKSLHSSTGSGFLISNGFHSDPIVAYNSVVSNSEQCRYQHYTT